MKSAARLFLVIGVLTIFLALYDFYWIWRWVEDFGTHAILSLFVWFGIGLTEIAVGWLIEEKK